MSDAHAHHDDAPKVFGLIAEFNEPETLMKATEAAYKAGYRRMDAYTPFPIEGLAEHMGVRKSAVAPLVLVGGITGALTGFGMQAFASVYHYPYSIGGRPDLSWPSFIPVTFELMVLFAAFFCFFGMLGLNGLPRPHHPIFNAKRFERASSDGFFLCIESDDPQFDPAHTRNFLEAQGPVEVSEVPA